MQHDPDLIQDIFDQAAELPMSEREAYLDEKCHGDAVLKAKIQSWLAQLKKIPTVEGVAPSQQPGPYVPGDRLGQYTITRELGAGGFGVVYLARQDNPSRDVAIKVILPEYSGRDSKFFERFKAEQEALARLEHPYIATLYTCGEDDQARPYIVMQYIDGEHLDTACDSHQLDIGERLRIAAELCDAVSHAHSKGLIHRDLKPGNILLSRNSDDEKWHPTVIDFGIAKAIEMPLSAQELTQGGRPMGTYGYMSPEQADGDLKRIGISTDVYALGVILYQLLAGRLPLEQAELDEYGEQAKKKMIREVDPPRPGSWLKTSSGQRGQQIAMDRSTEIGDLSRVLSRELEHIPMRALRKEPEERYDSAKIMGDDIRRYLKGDRLVAGPDSAAYRLRKSIRRNKGAYSAVAAIIMVLIAGVMVSLMFAFEAEASREVAEGQTSLAQESANIAAHEAKIAQIQSYVAHVEKAQKAYQDKDQGRFDRAMAKAELAWGKAYPDNALPFEFRYLMGRRDGSITTRDFTHEPWFIKSHYKSLPPRSVIGFNSDGSLMATLNPNETVIVVRDSATGRVVVELEDANYFSQSEPGEEPYRPKLVFNQNATVLASYSDVEDPNSVGKIRLWSLIDGGSPVKVIDREADYSANWRTRNWWGNAGVALSSDGNRVAYYSPELGKHIDDQRILVVDFSSGEVIKTIRPGHVTSCRNLVFSSDGSRLAWIGGVANNEYLSLVDMKTDELYGPRKIDLNGSSGNGNVRRALAIHPKRNEVAVAVHSDLVIHHMDQDDRPTVVTGDHNGGISAISYSPDGRMIATGTGAGEIRVFQITHFPNGKIILLENLWGSGKDRLRGHDERIQELHFTQDNNRLYSVTDSSVKSWMTSYSPGAIGKIGNRSARATAVTEDGRLVAIKTKVGGTALGQRLPRWILDIRDRVTGRHLAQLGKWPAHKTSMLHPQPLVFSSDGKLLAGSRRNKVQLWDVGTGLQIDFPSLYSDEDSSEYNDENLFEYQPRIAWVNDLAFSQNGRWLVVARADGTIACHDMEQTAGGPTVLDAHEGKIDQVAISPDGTLMVSCGVDNAIRIWSTSDWSTHRSILGYGATLLDFSSDGKLLATCGSDGDILVWETESLDCSLSNLATNPDVQPIARIQSPSAPEAIQFTADNRRIVAVCKHVVGFVDYEVGEWVIEFPVEQHVVAWSKLYSPTIHLSDIQALVPSRGLAFDIRSYGTVSLEQEQGRSRLTAHAPLVDSWIAQDLQDEEVMALLESEVKSRSVEEESTLRSLVLKKLVDRRAGPARRTPPPKRSSVPVMPLSRPVIPPTSDTLPFHWGPPTVTVDDE